VNHVLLDELDGKLHEYEMETHGSKQYVEQLQRSCLAPEILKLKLGAQVMCIKNAQDRSYVNGSLGKVIGFEKLTDNPIVELTTGRKVTIRVDNWDLMDGDKRRASIIQLPLRLAWAITVHKSQGMTLDAARIDLSRAFVEGMGYVALSRVRSMKHLILDGLNGMALKVSPLAKQIDQELRDKSALALQENAAHIKKWHQDEESGEHERQLQKAEEALAVDPTILGALREWRAASAQEQGKPPYIIAHDKTLEAVAAAKPKTEQELLKVPGFGSKKVETYGKDILAIVNNSAQKE
jgi:hypothetical protein